MTHFQQAQELFAKTIADCAVFRTLVGADTQEKALEKIFEDAVPEPKGEAYTQGEMIAMRPYGMIYFDNELDSMIMERDSTGGGYGCYTRSGILACEIHQNVTDDMARKPSQISREFRALMGDLADQFADLGEAGGYLLAERITLSGPFRST